MYVFTDSTLKYLLEKIKSKIALKSELDNKVDKIFGMEFSLNPDNEEAVKEIKNLESLKNLKIFYSPLNVTYTFEDLLYIEGTEELPSCYSLEFDAYQGGVCLDIEVLDNNQYKFVIYCNMNYPENTIVDFTIPEKNLSDNDFTDAAKQSLENKYASVEANYSTGMTHIKFSNEDQSNIKTIDLKTGCDMFFYPTIDAELFPDSEGNVTIPYAFISRSGSDIGKVTVNIENLTENTNSENVFNVTDNGSELVLESVSLGNTKISFTIEGDTEELKANVLGEYSTVIMSLLIIYRSTDASLVPSNVSDTKTVVSDFGSGEYEIMLYTATSINYLNFSNAQSLTNVSYISDSITDMHNTYQDCTKLTGQPVCGDNVTNMASTYYSCEGLTGSPVCGDNVINMYHAYEGCRSLTGNPVCGSNVTNMSSAYTACRSLTGSPVCGDKVTNMANTYQFCSKLTGSPVCGDKVTNMANTYYDCYNLTGSPVCGDNVANMSSTYRECYNLTGVPVCGNKVTNMSYAYAFCTNLTGPPVCGPNVTSMWNAYSDCYNLSSNGYFYSNKVTNVRNCFRTRNTSKMLNLYVPASSTTLTTCLSTSDSTSLTGTSISWTYDSVNNTSYNATYNICICPVANVKQAYKDNELLVTRYTMSSGANVIPEVDSTTMITTEDITNSDGTVTRSVYLDESQAGKFPSSISFNGATNLLTVEKLKIDNITDTSYMFNGCSNLTSICAMDWDTSKITKADYMFAGCSKLTKESFTSETIIKEHVLEYVEEGGSDSIDIGSIDNFVSIKYAIHEFTLDSFDTYDNGYSKRIGSDSTFTISNDGMCELYDGNEPQYECSVTVVYRYHEQIEFPNVESASHIFDGCTNLL